jgi:hypothetical protein
MAFLDQSYSVDTLPESQSIEPIPSGWYTATITEASLNTTKSGTGKYIKVRYDITGPTHEGRVVFGNLNIRNANTDAERIGLQQLGELMRAIGLARVQDTDELIGGRCSIKVSVREDKTGQYGPQNDIRGWKATEGSRPPMAQPAATMPKPAQTTATAPAASSPPWAKR